MKITETLFAGGVLVLILCSSLLAGADLKDPYQILDRHFETIGGLDKVRAENSSYLEGIFAMAGLEGTFKQWTVKPDRRREELDLTVFKETSGDNGEVSWVVDMNGKLKIVKDENALKRREVSRLKAELDHINPGSENFTVTFEGIEKVGDADCYVIKYANRINDDVTFEYFDTESFNVIKTIEKQPDVESHMLFSDFRESDGVIRSFAQDIEILPIGQKISLKIEKYEVNPEIDPALFEPPAEDVKDYEFASGGSSETVSFQFMGEHLYIMVNIGGKERMWILDTGASVTCISKRYAEELGLEAKGNLKGSGAGNVVEVSFATLPPFSIEGIKFQSQQAAVLDISMFFDRFNIDVAGIMGYDFLSRFTTRVDYAGRTLTFYDPDEFAYAGEGSVIDAPLQGNMFTAPITVDGTMTGRCTIDLGAGSDNIHYPYAKEKGLLERKGVERYGMGAGGEFREKEIKFKTIEFGGYTINDPIMDIPMDELEVGFGSAEVMGNLGNTLFRHFVLYLDYKNQQMIIEKGGDFGKDFPSDHSGLQIWFNDQKQYEVRHVCPGAPGEKAGFVQGDVINSINGIDMKYFDGYFAVVDLFRESPGTNYEVGIIRDGENKKLTLQLEDLFD